MLRRLSLALLLHAACFAPVDSDSTGDSLTASSTESTTASTGATSPTSGGTDQELRDCTWTQIGTDGPPAPRYGHSLTLETQGSLLMFGGRPTGSINNFDDLWRYDGSWTGVAAGGTPPTARRGFAAAVHPTLGLVVFGGDDDDLDMDGKYPAGTWAFDAGSWTSLSSVEEPTPRVFATMSYHPGTDRLVLFGGHDAMGVSFDDTWELDADGVWARSMGSSAPEPRSLHSMALNEGTGAIMVHGGCTSGLCTEKRDDTWAWDGVTWTLLDSGGTATFYGGAMSRGADNTLFRFMGVASPDGSLNTFQWLGGEWVELPSSPSLNPPASVEKFAVAYHPGEDAVILFGGLFHDNNASGQTWRFQCE